jgi:hypothetical protein
MGLIDGRVIHAADEVDRLPRQGSEYLMEVKI